MPRRLAIAFACLTTLSLSTPITAQMRPATSNAPPASPQAPPVPQRPANSGTGAISGVVLDGVTKRPVVGVLVYLGIRNFGPYNRTSSRQLTDAKGRFVYTDLPASNDFFMNASKAGYISGHYGDTEPTNSALGGSTIRLLDGQWLDGVTIYLWKPGVIAGTVSDERGEPVVNVPVRLLSKIMVAGVPHMASSGVTRTDDRGRYRMAGLTPGDYLVSVPSVQHAVPAGTSAQTIEGLAPGATPDEDRPVRNNGAMALDADHLLIIGNYATPPLAGAAPQAYPPTFYPGAVTLADATPVKLGPSETRESIDITLQPRPTVKVSGRLAGPADAVRGFVLRLVAAGLEDIGEGGETATTLAAPDGAFAFLNVPAGDYTLLASRSQLEYGNGPLSRTDYPLPGTPGKQSGPGTSLSGVPAAPSGTRASGQHAAGDLSVFARQALSVGNADVTGVIVPLRRAVSMHGRIVWDGAGAPPGPTLISLEPADGDTALGMQMSTTRPSIDDDPSFTVNGVMPGAYIVRALGLNPRQALKSVVVRGRDLSFRPIDASGGQDIDDVVVTYTDQLASLTGSVAVDPASAPMSVIAFPVERELWSHYGLSAQRFQTAPVSNDGTYSIANIPAGTYYLVAVETSGGRRWQDPAFLEEAAKGAPQVSVAWGETKSQSLKVSVIK